MRPFLFLKAFAVLLILVPSFVFGVEPSALDRIDQYISELFPYLGSYPPVVSNQKELAEVQAKLDAAITYTVNAMEKNPKDAQIKWRLGEFYRLAHNSNQPKAWENSEKYLKEAISLDPKSVEAYLALGHLYVNTDFKYAKAAENCFITAQKVAGTKVLVDAHRGLFFAYYYQGQMQKAVEEADIVLHAQPGDVSISRLKEFAESKLKK